MLEEFNWFSRQRIQSFRFPYNVRLLYAVERVIALKEREHMDLIAYDEECEEVHLSRKKGRSEEWNKFLVDKSIEDTCRLIIDII